MRPAPAWGEAWCGPRPAASGVTSTGMSAPGCLSAHDKCGASRAGLAEDVSDHRRANSPHNLHMASIRPSRRRTALVWFAGAAAGSVKAWASAPRLVQRGSWGTPPPSALPARRLTGLRVAAASGRTFDELSSQGLKTLVNIAHALAHHIVAIDRNLPLPGLLILDGLSANAGHEGFDQERIRDVYRLLSAAANKYGSSLQVTAVDNVLAQDLLHEFLNYVKLTLTQKDRLIRIPATDGT